MNAAEKPCVHQVLSTPLEEERFPLAAVHAHERCPTCHRPGWRCFCRLPCRRADAREVHAALTEIRKRL